MGKIIGIDLGTTNSLAAICDQDGPSVLPLAGGATFLPSAVGMDPGEGLVVGKRARDGLRLRPESTILSVKRHMGTDRKFVLGGEELRPQDVSALILRELKRSVETQLLTPVERVVISVPAYFNEVQRRATREAGEIAGLRVERLISEPTAAALAYGIERLDTEGSILVYDLGGGTFDVSILEMFEGVFSVRASGGDTRLGGDDFDDRITRWLLDRVKTMGNWGEPAPDAALHLRLAVEKAKCELTGAASATIVVERLPFADGKERSLKAELTRAQFEKLTRDLLERTGRCISRVLGEAGLARDRIGDVLLVGGSTRMPMVASYLAELFGREPKRSVDPLHAVALGAAVQAQMLSGGSSYDDIIVTDVSPFTLGIAVVAEHGGEMRPGVFVPLIHRNSSLPARKTREFSTCHPEQDSVAIEVYQGDDPLVENNILLDRYYLGGFPTTTGQAQELEITFQYDVDGILNVQAIVKSTGKSAGIRIDPGKMQSVGQGLVVARARVDSLWSASLVSRRLRSLIKSIEQRRESWPESDRGSLEEKLGRARQALEQGNAEQMAKLVEELTPWE